MYNIYFGNKCISLTADSEKIKMEEGVCYMSFDSLQSLEMAVQTLENNSIAHKFIIAHHSLDELFTYFSSLFKPVTAAGGVVKDSSGRYLLIFRNGKWDLPKGKIEKKEAAEAAAIREVEEECGISKLSIQKALPDTYHVYVQDGKRILKTTHWYEMLCKDKNAPAPQQEEGIEQVKWLDRKEAREKLTGSYASLKEFAEKIFNA